MSFQVTARTEASPERVWALYAQPERWREWAPHIRRPRGLGDPEVQAGARGTVHLGGLVPVPATIIEVEPGRSWTWRVGPMKLRHSVEPASPDEDYETLIGLEVDAPAGIETALRASYGPVTSLLLRNLARVAER